MNKHVILTVYALVVPINDKSFSITISEPNEKQSSQLTAMIKEHSTANDKRSDLQQKLRTVMEEFDLNKTILEHAEGEEKLTLSLEQKALNREIPQLMTDIDALSGDLEKSTIAYKEMYEKKFELLISGKDKALLKKELKDMRIDYATLFESIGILAKKAKDTK